MKLYLASTSPRRKELLKKLGIPFEVVVPTFIESSTALSPEEEVLHFAREKARSVASDYPQSLIIGSDTMVVCEGQKIGKPSHDAEAQKILSHLSGKTHEVLTAVVLLNTMTGEEKTHIEKAHVTFKSLSPEEIRHYIASGEPQGKAGAYAIQGREGQHLVEKLEGDVEAVMGLCLTPLREWLAGRLSSRPK